VLFYVGQSGKKDQSDRVLAFWEVGEGEKGR
jgi:hypothetical protein